MGNYRDPIVRAFRTFYQAAIGTFIATSVLGNVMSTSTIDADALQRAGISAVAAGLIALLSFFQNYGEDATGKSLGPK